MQTTTSGTCYRSSAIEAVRKTGLRHREGQTHVFEADTRHLRTISVCRNDLLTKEGLPEAEETSPCSASRRGEAALRRTRETITHNQLGSSYCISWLDCQNRGNPRAISVAI
jgi:hypothetical protein